MTSTLARTRHLRAFLRLLWQRFNADRCFEAAGALSYTTIFALVPLATVFVGVFSALPAYAIFSRRASDFMFENFVPGAARAVQTYLADFAANATQLTWLGIGALLLSAFMMLMSAEDTLNRIFRAPAHRTPGRRAVMYWTVLTLGPLLVALVFALTAAVWALPGAAEAQLWMAGLLRLSPTFIVWLGVTLAFRVVPNTHVRLRHAALGALVTTVLFVLAKRALAAYLGSGETYQQIYGALAVIPVLLIWIYVSWSAVLLGALFAASLGAYRSESGARSRALELPCFMLALVRLRVSCQQGRRFDRLQWQEACTGLTAERAADLLAFAATEGLLRVDDAGDLVPTPARPTQCWAGVVERGGFAIPAPNQLAQWPVAQGEPERMIQAHLRTVIAAVEQALSEPVEVLLQGAAAGVAVAAPGAVREA